MREVRTARPAFQEVFATDPPGCALAGRTRRPSFHGFLGV